MDLYSLETRLLIVTRSYCSRSLNFLLPQSYFTSSGAGTSLCVCALGLYRSSITDQPHRFYHLEIRRCCKNKKISCKLALFVLVATRTFVGENSSVYSSLLIWRRR